jgi:hypothetical protein
MTSLARHPLRARLCLALLALATASAWASRPASAAAPTAVTEAAPGQGGLAGWRGVTLPGAACGRGAPYKYYLSLPPGAPAGIVFVLSGGGACLKEGHAPAGVGGVAQQLHCMDYDNFTDPFMTDLTVLTGGLGSLVPYLRRNAENPLRDYAYVALPYCTGDVHAGRMTTPYDYDPAPTATFAVTHRGALNVLAVLDDVRRQLPGDMPVVLTGFSAGGFGAILNYPAVLSRWPRTTLIPDAGIAPPHPLSLMRREGARVAERWGALPGLPSYCQEPACLADTLGLLAAHAAHFDGDPGPWRAFGYLQGQQDGTLADYLELSRCGYQLGLRQGHASAARQPNLRAWLPATSEHVFGFRADFAAGPARTQWRAFFYQVAGATTVDELPADALDPWGACNPLALPLLRR